MRQAVTILLALVLAAVVPAAAQDEPNEKLAVFRKAFDEKYNAILDNHAAKARRLRASYLEALENLKLTLGREENLKGAAQTLAEIEAVENGESREIPKDADRRLVRLRETWDREIAQLFEQRDQEITQMVDKYFKALKEEERTLTRAGEIKEALRFKEEVERVEKLPEVAAATKREDQRDPRGAPSMEELTRAITGTTWRYKVRKADFKDPLDLVFSVGGKAVIAERYHLSWEALPDWRLKMQSRGKEAFIVELDRDLKILKGTNAEGYAIDARRVSDLGGGGR